MFVSKDYEAGIIFLSYISCFLVGAFFSNFMVEMISRKKQNYSYSTPIIIETFIIVIAAFLPDMNKLYMLPYVLLFAMGLQNALVTKVSRSVVRTTHLTGLFTDLGIELSQMIFYRTKEERHQLLKGINLKIAIIMFFFIGGVVGGLMYTRYQLKTLLLASVFLVLALFYDNILLKFYTIRKKIKFK